MESKMCVLLDIVKYGMLCYLLNNSIWKQFIHQAKITIPL